MVVRREPSVKISLSDEQRKAVEADAPRVVVSAGAGAGKTRVLTARFLRRIEEGCDLERIAAVTFTEKAAGELKRRIREALHEEGRKDDARRVPDAWVATIHGLCRRILREHALEVGMDPEARVLSQHEALMLASEAMESAIQACVDEQEEDVLFLLDKKDIGTVAKWAKTAYDQIVAAGLDPLRAEPQPPVTPADARGLARRLRESAEKMSGFKQTATRDSNIESLQRAAQALEAVSEGTALQDLDRLLDVLETLATCSSAARGCEEFKEAAQRAQQTLDEAKAMIAQALVAPVERGIARLVARFSEEYAKAKRSAAAMDFEDLQTYVACLLTENQIAARELRERFEEVLVDEFQDTNRLQSRIVSALAGRCLVAVGDKRQSIYRFRFADVGVFDELASTGLVRTLTENRRSHPDVLEVVNHVFGDPRLFGPSHDHLRAVRQEGRLDWPDEEPRVRVLLAIAEGGTTADDARRAEAEVVAEEISRLCESGLARPSDIAILSRQLVNRARMFEEALRRRGIESVSTASDFFSTAEVADGVMLLRVIDNVWDDEAWVHVLAGTIGRVSPSGLARLRAASPKDGLWRAILGAEAVLSGHDLERVRLLRGAVQAARSRRGLTPPGDVLVDALRRSGHEASLRDRGAAGARAWANLLLLARLVDESDQLTGRGMRGFLAELKGLESLGIGQAPVGEDVEAVRIMTIHAAKGLEFPVVFVVGLTEGENAENRSVLVDCSGDTARIASALPEEILGGREIKKKPKPRGIARLAEDETAAQAEEEKRLLYVAFTRAQEALFLAGAVGGTPGPARAAVLEALGVERAVDSEQEAVKAGGVTIPVARRAPAEAMAASVASSAAVPGSARGERVPEAGASEGVPSGGFVPRRLSPSALEDFERCPYRYYASHVLKLSNPAAGEGATAFGTIVHEALRSAVTGTWSEERLEAVARRHAISEEDLARLRELVEVFRESETADALDAYDRVSTEAPLSMVLGETLVSGRMDVLARSAESALVVDFKWHEKEPAKPELDQERYRRQMACYALAALKSGARTARALVYDAASGRISAEWEFTAADAPGLEAELQGLIERITASDFRPLEKYEHEACVGCPALGGLCSVRGPKRADGAGRTRR